MHFTSSLALAAIASVASAIPATKVARADDGPIGYAAQNGGTTGGAGGTTTTVSALSAFTEAVTADGAAVIFVKGTISGDVQTKVASDKSILGIDSSSGLEGVSLYIKDVSNVIVRNLAMSKVLADTGDAIGIQKATNVWIDHMDLSSDRDHDKDYYDGLCDVTHAADFVTISNTYFHDHWKASLVGHSDSNGDEDTGYLHVTYANNYWKNVNSRAPSVRFGTAHIFNSYYDTLDTGVNTRMGAEVLVESTTFAGCEDPIESVDSDETGTAAVNDVDLGEGTNTAPEGSLTVDYDYTLLGSADVKSAVVGVAGNTLTLG
ncbi:putative pectate lyase A [Pseudocercospora fuligena]|uniref:pectate lyase n=1 Tax=Pseudocercospora fuligena TaxID=685502 RepID=A0A8H6RD29_9PEZI|nr:putative pectate lyase A [Pseudocercospora fuligena]